MNFPLIADKMAARVVIYSDQRGGYIDNVPATFTRKNTDIGIHYAQFPAVNGACPDGLPNNGWCVPPGSFADQQRRRERQQHQPGELHGRPG